MEAQLYKVIWEYLSANTHPTKSFQALARIKFLQYQSRKPTGKETKQSNKFRCHHCSGVKFEHILMLIIHQEILHPNFVEKYSISGDTVIVIENTKPILLQQKLPYLEPLKNSSGASSTLQQPFFIGKKQQTRISEILNGIADKLERALHKKQQIYLHSTDIFRQISEDQLAEDSQDELGEVEKELEKLRIEDFGDVNANDKKFFIEWNCFMHEKRREMQIIFAFQIPKLFIEFCSLIRQEEKGIPRINLVMHAWTLWSSGQISSTDVILGLNQFDRRHE